MILNWHELLGYNWLCFIFFYDESCVNKIVSIYCYFITTIRVCFWFYKIIMKITPRKMCTNFGLPVTYPVGRESWSVGTTFINKTSIKPAHWPVYTFCQASYSPVLRLASQVMLQSTASGKFTRNPALPCRLPYLQLFLRRGAPS